MSGQQWHPQRYAREAGYVAELGRPLVDLLAPSPGERVLDLGCGDGTLSLEAHLWHPQDGWRADYLRLRCLALRPE